ncbi:MAG: glycosyltransferase family 2 protein [Clostridiales bacterium]|nr:glycosyltransferase family 2 protein [Clostridiales bacterium]
MLKGKTIATLVSAYNEGKLITKTLSTMPKFVDKIIVVNDCGTDDTLDRILEYMKKDKRVVLIKHEVNMGLGSTIKTGFKKSLELDIDVTAIMNGDAQMHPDDLINICTPMVEGKSDFSKGNRLLHTETIGSMPKYRLFGNSILTFLSKMASGYWHVIDSQCGYSAISKEALKRIPFHEITPRYGYNADLLNLLNIANCSVIDVSVKAVYGEEESKIKIGNYIVKTSALLLRLFIRRMWRKYFILDFNPLVFFYMMSVVCLLFVSFPMFIRFFYRLIWLDDVAKTTALICALSFFMGFQFLFFGMWMDMDDNKRLNPRIKN